MRYYAHIVCVFQRKAVCDFATRKSPLPLCGRGRRVRALTQQRQLDFASEPPSPQPSPALREREPNLNQRLSKLSRDKWSQIINPLADADKAQRNWALLGDGADHAAFGAAVEFGHHETGQS